MAGIDKYLPSLLRLGSLIRKCALSDSAGVFMCHRVCELIAF